MSKENIQQVADAYDKSVAYEADFTRYILKAASSWKSSVKYFKEALTLEGMRQKRGPNELLNLSERLKKAQVLYNV